MTFKHVKFEDSPTMRALEKVAREKGLVKPEPLTKKASLVKKADLTPTDNLMENILKLCNGLREQGFVKDASELEGKFLQYKQAQTLYETSPEKGEDVVEFAHPEGSHKLRDVDSTEAVVEDILDKHDLIEEVAKKNSKGKLTDAASVISAVRVALAQESDEEAKDAANLEAGRQAYANIIAETTALIQQILQSEDLSDITYQGSHWGGEWAGATPTAWTGMALRTTQGHFEGVQDNLNQLTRKSPSVDNVGDIRRNLNSMMSLIQSASNISGVNKGKYLRRTQDIYSRTENILKVMRGEAKPPSPSGTVTIPEVTITEGPLGKIFRQIGSLKEKLKMWSAYRSVAKNSTAMKWIKDEIAALDDIDKRYGEIPEDQEANAAPQMQREVDAEANDINEFEKSWINA